MCSYENRVVRLHGEDWGLRGEYEWCASCLYELYVLIFVWYVYSAYSSAYKEYSDVLRDVRYAYYALRNILGSRIWDVQSAYSCASKIVIRTYEYVPTSAVRYVPFVRVVRVCRVGPAHCTVSISRTVLYSYHTSVHGVRGAGSCEDFPRVRAYWERELSQLSHFWKSDSYSNVSWPDWCHFPALHIAELGSEAWQQGEPFVYLVENEIHDYTNW